MRYVVLLLLVLLISPCVYADSTVAPGGADASVVEGVFSQVSKLPAAAGNPYPDCYYTATLDLQHIVSGKSIPRRIVLVLPGFFSRQYAPEANYKVGDKVRAVVVPFASMPEKVRQTQQADEVEDVDLEFYYPKEIAPITQFQTVPKPVPFAVKGKKAETAPDLKPTDTTAKAARREAMQHDLDRINNLLTEHGGDWDKWYQSLNNFRAEYRKQYAAKAQKWVGNSFFSAGYIADKKAYNTDYIKSVISFKNYLAAHGIDLILVRVPFKGEIADDLFAPVPSDGVSNPYLLRMYKELLEADVEIVADIIPKAKESRLKYPLMYWYSDFNEWHPAEGIARVVADEFADRLKRYKTIQNSSNKVFKLTEVTTASDAENWLWAVEKCNPLWPAGNPNFNPKAHIQFTAVSTGDGKPVGRKVGTDSPILLVGSSFTAYPSLKLGANIPSYLAYLTGIAPDILYRSGSDASIPRIIAREGNDVLKNRTVCVFPMAPWAFEAALDSPPIIDPAKATKAILASHDGRSSLEQIEFAKGTATVSSGGSFTITAPGTESQFTANFTLRLPEALADYPFFMIELDSRPGDGAVIKVQYRDQTDTIHKSYTQTNTNDSFIFRAGTDRKATFDLSTLRRDIPTIINRITIYGLRQ